MTVCDLPPSRAVAALLEELPQLVREARRHRGVSQRHAAEQAGCDYQVFSRIERGRSVSLRNAIALLRWLEPQSWDRPAGRDGRWWRL